MPWPFDRVGRRGATSLAPKAAATRKEVGHGPAAVAAEDLVGHADEAAGYLKALGHEGRLMILCHLIDGEKSVTELETLLASRQAAVSQQLARLRLEGLVTARRDGKAIYYSLSDPRTARMIEVLSEMFCG